ncbi:type I-E CRISPR-associated protein Cas7/Cse4/CasC [Actinoalloteichus caeruleus]|uniref:type I-E CRISPR-associated protein Cas7/Cse4/CasC n=1 Tax=Actinoalloteichus cyanogriseus TaxID=2893586 RepID=UPI003BB9381A
MIIELHLLQSFPVSNLNRDDVGQPKTATFGGAVRGRVSSQCLKRSARQLLPEHGLKEDETGVRTKRLRDQAAEMLAGRGHGRDLTTDIATAGLESLGLGVEASSGRTEYLLFVNRQAVDVLADHCERHWDELVAAVEAKRAAQAKAKEGGKGAKSNKKEDKAKNAGKKNIADTRRLLDAGRAVDIALFGRMIADNKEFNVDAASQVAHALSTHAVTTEFDYYTAVDDQRPDEDSGADMIGTVDFNSACYYRYANVNLERLRRNLGGDEELLGRAARAWLGAFIHAVPSGKQNSMAALTLPHTLLGVVRDAGSWNLANAFLKPVGGSDLMATSTDRLLSHLAQLRRFYGGTQLRAVVGASVDGHLPSLPVEEVAGDLASFVDRVATTAVG